MVIFRCTTIFVLSPRYPSFVASRYFPICTNFFRSQIANAFRLPKKFGDHGVLLSHKIANLFKTSHTELPYDRTITHNYIPRFISAYGACLRRLNPRNIKVSYAALQLACRAHNIAQKNGWGANQIFIRASHLPIPYVLRIIFDELAAWFNLVVRVRFFTEFSNLFSESSQPDCLPDQ